MDRILYSCVLDSHPKFMHQVLVWIWSLTTLAKQHPGNLLVHMIDGCPSNWYEMLEQYGINIRTIKTFDSRSPHCNKIVQLESDLIKSSDTVILCDTDIAFTKDIINFLNSSNIQARTVDRANPPIAVWEEIILNSGIDAPLEAIKPMFDSIPTYVNNYNGGFYVIPNKYINILADSWKHWALWLMDHIDYLKEWKVHVDQVAFGLAVAENHIEVDQLPPHINFPVHNNYALTYNVDIEPTVIHYHDHVDRSGFINPTGLRNVDKVIQTINTMVADKRQENFHNQVFWDFRYSTAPETGSGIGSRGEHLLYKQNLISSIVNKIKPGGILEVGCGDLEVSKVLEHKNYLGIDISTHAIEISAEKRADWNFMQGNLLDIEVEPRSMVICLDVLLHQPNHDIYQAFVNRLIELCDDTLMIAAYNQKPWYTSEITFYYEPITETLLKHPDISALDLIGAYRDITIVLATK